MQVDFCVGTQLCDAYATWEGRSAVANETAPSLAGAQPSSSSSRGERRALNCAGEIESNGAIGEEKGSSRNSAHLGADVYRLRQQQGRSLS